MNEHTHIRRILSESARSSRYRRSHRDRTLLPHRIAADMRNRKMPQRFCCSLMQPVSSSFMSPSHDSGESESRAIHWRGWAGHVADAPSSSGFRGIMTRISAVTSGFRGIMTRISAVTSGFRGIMTRISAVTASRREPLCIHT